MSEENKEMQSSTEQEQSETQEVNTEEPKELSEVDKLKEEIEKLQTQLNEATENYVRAHADFENMKKRLEREKFQAIEYAYEKFAQDLLAPLDSLDMALFSVTNSEAKIEDIAKNLEDGINLTIEQFKKSFAKHGIELIEIGEEGFNPHLHEALMRVDSEAHESGEVVQVLQKGYKYKDRLLRPTKVSVAN